MTGLNPFEQLPREVTPPPALRGRVLDALRARGLVRRGPSGRAFMALAASLALFAGGAWVGARAASPAGQGGPLFALLLYEPAGFDTTRSHEELAAEYGAWAGGLGDGFVAGDALGAQRAIGGAVPGDVPTGYFIVRAADWDAAMAIARGCPHVRYGGVVAVRAIVT